MTSPPLLCSTAGLRQRLGDARAILGWVATTPVRGVALDTTHPDLRPRLLERAARRELAATIYRLELNCGGVDLPIPAEHFESAENADRAVAAVVGAIGLVSELRALGAASARPVVCITLTEAADGGVIDTIADAASREGVVIASLGGEPASMIDLGAIVRAGADSASGIAERVAGLGERLGCVRIDRFDRATLDAVRLAFIAAGVGSPDAAAVVDCSGAAEPAEAIAAAAGAWAPPAGFPSDG